MVNLVRTKTSKKIREVRYFSDSFKRDIVKQIEQNIVTVTQVSREHQVSRSAIYKWIYKYSKHLKKGLKYVIEPESDAKKVEFLRERIKALERHLGQKQLQIEFLDKLIEIAEEDLGIEIKKKHGKGPYPGFGKTGRNTTGK